MRGVTVLHVPHASRVAAISTGAGPTRLLEAGLAEALGEGGGSVEVVEVPLPDGALGEVAASFSVADHVARGVRGASARDRLAVVLSGSCHTGLGSVSGLPGGARGVVWLDCHGDFNTPETTGSGLLDGMTLAAVTGRCWKGMCSRVTGFAPVPDERVILVGVRDLDPGEADLLDASGITVIHTEEAPARAPGALERLGRAADGVYVHLDLDVLDASVGRANAFAMGGGFSTEGLGSLLGILMKRCPVRAVAFTSYDPQADEDGAVARAAVELAEVLGVAAARGHSP